MNATAMRAERWRAPKPLVGIRTLEKLLNRHTAVSCPESRLVVAVIGQAIFDCLAPGRRPRREARRFLLGDDLTPRCDLGGLNPDFVRFVAQKAGYLADEQQPKKAGRAKPPLQPQQPAAISNPKGART